MKQIIPIYKRIYVGRNPALHNLPSEYTEVEYLQTDGNSWIACGNDSPSAIQSDVECDIEFEAVYSVGILRKQQGFGYNDPFHTMGTNHNGYPAIGTSSVVSVAFDANTPYRWKLQFKNTNTTGNNSRGWQYDMDGTQRIYMLSYGRNAVTTPYTIFSTTINPRKMTSGSNYYGSTVKKDGVLVGEFIPCYRNSDSVAGVYDIVNNVFYTNSGTGSFIVGQDVPKYITYSTLPTYVSGADVNTQRIIKTLPRYVKEVEPDYLCFTAQANTDIKFGYNGAFTLPTLQYRVNNGSWTNYSFNTAISLNNGDKCYWKGDNNTFSVDGFKYVKFTSTGLVSASGNIMSLVDSSCQSTTIPCAFCFYRLFADCSTITTAPKLPATTLKGSCYGFMLAGCTSLETAPNLPATTLTDYCYSYMFYFCTSLTTIPKLPATTLTQSCYSNMFGGCTSLYVSDTSIAQATHEWRIPTSGTFTNTYSQSSMFSSCKGTRSSNNMGGQQGQSYTYYTQNEPI